MPIVMIEGDEESGEGDGEVLTALVRSWRTVSRKFDVLKIAVDKFPIFNLSRVR